MDDNDHAQRITALAHRIEHLGLRDVAHMFLDLLEPLDIINSQMVQFMHPFVRRTRLEHYAELLATPTNWQALRTLLTRQEC